MDTPENTDDIIDSRDVIARIEELTEARDEALGCAHCGVVAGSHAAEGCEGEYEPGGPGLDEEEAAELATLEVLAEEGESLSDWKYGETLIRDSYFETYAQELAEDCGMLENATSWPGRCIDWEQAARELQQDYTALDFDGVTYWGLS